jgi:arsenate reductase-like glutaredoxin family protein
VDTYVTLYGAKGCSKTLQTEQHLKQMGVPYNYINVSANPIAQNDIRDLHDGELKLPTVIVEHRGTRMLLAPSESELDRALIDTAVAPWIAEA